MGVVAVGRVGGDRRARRKAGCARDRHGRNGCDRTETERLLVLRCFADMSSTAYWIAFGPHGPRAETPPGEPMKVFTYTVIGVAASLVIFLITHHFANPPPTTLTKEWQEATNEYFKVCTCPAIQVFYLLYSSLTIPFAHRKTRSSLSQVSHP